MPRLSCRGDVTSGIAEEGDRDDDGRAAQETVDAGGVAKARGTGRGSGAVVKIDSASRSARLEPAALEQQRGADDDDERRLELHVRVEVPEHRPGRARRARRKRRAPSRGWSCRASTTAASTSVSADMSSPTDGRGCRQRRRPGHRPARSTRRRPATGPRVSLTTSTPRVAARSMFAAVARLSRPRRPTRNRNVSATSASTAMATARIS